MRFDEVGWGSGHVFRVERRQGSVWYAKYRLPDGRQVKRKIGPAWSGRRRPRVGYFTRRGAEEWRRETLDDARERAHAGARRTDATFAEAAREWLRYVEHDRACKPSTLRSYRSTLEAHLLPAFGAMRVHEITPGHIERWRAGLTGSPRTKNKLLTELHGVFRRAQKVYGLERNPAAEVEKLRQRRRLDLDVFTPEEVRALCRAAASEQDAAIYLTAAFTGLRRGELIALRWRDVDFPASRIRVSASYAGGQLTAPKSGKVRSVPLASEVASMLAQLGQRERWTGDDDVVFPGELGTYLDGSALRRRYLEALERAGLRRLRFHDLRHTFGTAMIAKADILRVMEWMGHADVQTTRGHLHYRPRPMTPGSLTKRFYGRRSRTCPELGAGIDRLQRAYGSPAWPSPARTAPGWALPHTRRSRVSWLSRCRRDSAGPLPRRRRSATEIPLDSSVRTHASLARPGATLGAFHVKDRA